MVHTCCIPLCASNSRRTNNNISYFNFPDSDNDVHEIPIINHGDNEDVSTLENQNEDEQLQNSNGIPKPDILFSYEKFKSSDKDIRFYTGFPCSKALDILQQEKLRTIFLICNKVWTIR